MSLFQPLFLQATTGDTPITYAAQDLRRLTAALAPVQGTVLAGDLLVSQRAAGANMTVDVAAGQAFIAGTSMAGQGTYMVRSDAVTNVTLQAANASNPRWDAIVARVYDKQADGGTSYSWSIQAITGTPASSPVAPATPASSLLLAYVWVAANAASITNSQVTDKRVLSGQGDVPKWDFSGTSGPAQTVASTANTLYAPANFFQAIGILRDPTTAKVTILTPGRYMVHWSTRLGNSTSSGLRNSNITLASSTGTALREIAAEINTSFNSPVTAAGTLYCRAGDVINAAIYQTTGQTLSIDDSHLDTNFTGVWVGP